MARLGELTNIKTGKLDANAASSDGRYPFFTCSKEALRIGTYQYDCECVLVAGNGDLNVKYYSGKFDAYQRTYIIESKDKSVLLVPYLYYFLDGYVETLRQQAIGGVIKYIKLGNLTEAQIPLPDMCVQSRIVEQLDRLDRLISLRKQQLAKLEELVKARFVEMFGDLINNPMGWKFEKLSSLCDVRDGTHDSPEYQNEGFPLLTSKNFSSGIIDFSDCNLISEEDFEMINRRSKVDYGDIIMPMIGTIGHPVIVDTNRPFAIKNVALIKFNNGELSNIFVKAVLDSDYFLTVTATNNRGGTQKFIALGDIRNILIPMVPRENQLIFGDFVEQVHRQKLTIQPSLDKLETLKKSLMQEYFG